MPELTQEITCGVPVHHGMCKAPLTQVPYADTDEWAWADASGSITGDRYLFNPYEELEALKFAGQLGAYHALKVELDLAGSFHMHRPLVYPVAIYPDRPDDHCGWPSYLSPRGWLCRVCKAELTPKEIPADG